MFDHFNLFMRDRKNRASVDKNESKDIAPKDPSECQAALLSN